MSVSDGLRWRWARRQRRTAEGLIVVLLGIVIGLAPSPSILAQSGPSLEVSVGFKGAFVPGETAPITVEVDHEGVPIDGRLIVRQTWRPLMEASRTIEGERSVTLGPKARLRYTFHQPLYGDPPPNGDSPELSVVLRSKGQALVRRDVALDDKRRRGLVLMASDSGYLQELPTGETTIQLSAADLPQDWRAYGGVKRLYLGRLDVTQISKDQQAAIRRWVTSGGELVVLSGGNAYRQDADWLNELSPFRVESVASPEAFGARMAQGEAKGQVVYADDGHPLLTRWRVGRGEVSFSALSLTETGPAQAEIWSRLEPGRTELEGPFELGAQLFRRMPLYYPDKVVVAGAFTAYVLGIGLLLLWALRRTPWRSGGRFHASTASSDDGTLDEVEWHRLWVGMVIWIGLAAAFVVGYSGQPAFSERVQALEASIMWGSARSGLVHEATGHSAMPKRRLTPRWTLPTDTAVLPLRRTDIAITDAGAAVEPRSATLVPRQVYDVALESVRRLDVRAEPTGDSSVEPDGVRIYNGSGSQLRQPLVWHQGDYATGSTTSIAPDTQAVINLDDAEATAKPWDASEGRPPGGFASAAKRTLFNAVDRRLRERGDPWALLAWIREPGFDVQPEEYRETWRLLLVTPW